MVGEMKTKVEVITSDLLKKIQQVEKRKKEEILEDIKNIYEGLYCSYDLHFKVSLINWIDTVGKIKNKKYDQYTTTIQVDILYRDKNVILPNENIQCSPFQNITYIQWKTFEQKYIIYENDNFDELFDDLNNILNDINKCGFGYIDDNENLIIKKVSGIS